VDGNDVYMNPEALDTAEGALDGRAGLAAMKSRFAGIATPGAMFGEVPNGQAAEAALTSAAHSMLEQLERAGISVEDIAASAGVASAIAIDSDQASTEVLRIGPHQGWRAEVEDATNPDIVREEDKFDDPHFVDPLAVFDERMNPAPVYPPRA
jgi:hypothetical protein